MQLNDFDFALPNELIAQQPAVRRDASRLMCLERGSRTLSCRKFLDILEYFRPGDLLVVNDTRVIPARLLGKRATGGKVEIFLLRRDQEAAREEWFCLTKSSKPLGPGTRIELSATLTAEILEVSEGPYRRVRFEGAGEFLEQIEEIGHLPLPPYIKRPDSALDRDRYQTVFARERGAVAAPTAGLHFTAALLESLREKGVNIAPVTLHVGLGTFLPVRVEDIRQHRMHAEGYAIPAATAAAVNATRRDGGRIFALGTTSVRALESAATADGLLPAGRGESEIFICPGYRFKVVDALITNFHLPKSTLLMLVAAFAGREFVLSAYQRAVAERFRFFSYGDCMLIL
jgi:S-adenosylmethionine:tRNA ribosyltransferase-isomerase